MNTRWPGNYRNLHRCTKLYCAPGNAGIEDQAECVPIQVDEIDKLVVFAQDNAIDLVVVGPENPLVDGLADKMKQAGIDVFGPSADAAELEGSKGFMKDLCAKYNINSAKYGRFKDIESAQEYYSGYGRTDCGENRWACCR